MTNERDKLIKSLRAKINFGHPIYLWELLLVVKYILQEGDIYILNRLRSHELPKVCLPTGICGALIATLQKLYFLQTVKTGPLSIAKTTYYASESKRTIMMLLARVYSKIYNTAPPEHYFYWFHTTEERLKFLDTAIEKFKDSKECYILREELTMGHIHSIV